MKYLVSIVFEAVDDAQATSVAQAIQDGTLSLQSKGLIENAQIAFIREEEEADVNV
jgi:hypothetical protein